MYELTPIDYDWILSKDGNFLSIKWFEGEQVPTEIDEIESLEECDEDEEEENESDCLIS